MRAVCLTLLCACGELPAPIISGLTPTVVCGSGTLPVSVGGEHFYARPVRTLAGEPALEAPSAQLIPESGATVHPQVVWLSTQLLSLKVPLDQLATGVYALELSDPDGQQAKKGDALTRVQVPPVAVTMLAPAAFCLAQADTSIAVQGSGFADGATVSIRDGAGNVVLQPGGNVGHDTISLTLAAGSLMPGDYTLVVENPPEAGCSATAAASLTIDSPPVLTQVTGNVCPSGGRITVSGDHLLGGAAVELRLGTQRLSATQVMVTSPTSAVVTFPANNLPGNARADLDWHNPDGCDALFTGAVRLKPGQGGCL